MAAALRTMAEGQQQMASGVVSRHEQEAAALSGIAAAAKRGVEQADGKPRSQCKGCPCQVSGLAGRARLLGLCDQNTFAPE